ncbi:thiol reductant ABC exporter subunit CydD [Salisediminibacterium selenitireducens]|uniref:ABC transporter, CydDC cysteine exporter (CydDC-E) family, permease/ATP-binding protein CydD n=1 Tax=Bacillus selenitireducens (strain ATCC 700615 / DSM 15326 / MLS10) TaxID=439292 RepID=D6XYP4_BACIE|nr:thiol reductant ABC exporter subunit CydD [Salisediminibacterium selenitireducens]ADH98202.1 ABC transporter, CydDC cysteine exporter (CydDC-E) family, permease/ATP-binding protein CydD [[Bacillus] selenitireducens MLS10]
MQTLKEWTKQKRNETILLRLNAVALGLSIVAMAWFIVRVVDGVFLQGEGFWDVVPYLILTAVALLFRSLFTWLGGRIGIRLGTQIKQEYRQWLTEDADQKSGQLTGERTGVFVDAVDEVEGYVKNYYPQLIQSSTVPLVLLAAIFYMNWVSGLILLVTAPFIPIMMIVVGKNAEKRSEAQMEKLNRFSGTFMDLLQGLVTLRFLGKSKEKAGDIAASSMSYRDATMDVLKVAFLSSLMLEFISMLSISLVALEVGLRLVIFDQLTFFTAFFVLILAPEFFASLKELGTAFHNGKSSTGAWERVKGAVGDGTVAVKNGDRDMPADASLDLEAKGMAFSYGAGQFALGPVDFSIPEGNHVAIVGPSGSGKSTLLQLITGLRAPESGELTVSGIPVHALRRESWFREISYLTQHPYLFSGTLRENIRMGALEDILDSDILEAAKDAGLTSLIDRLPQGLDTPIGEAGRGLSGGERQRIALARAFLKKPRLIVFDEPTTGLDLRTEQILQAGIRTLSEKATMITVAHRLHTIREADRILFMDNGRIIANGKHSELINTVPAYRQMVSVETGGDAS